ncbi:MAG: prepilin peptidase [Thermomicrobium sp.]|nr:prepilin peptidase [Thermomicrobium sp.]
MLAPALPFLPVAAVLGFVLGGLVELAALRLPSGEPLLARATCLTCGAERSRWSWLLPRSCPSCGSFPRSQFVLQLLAATTVAAAWLRFLPTPLDAFRVCLFGLFLWLIARIDWAHHLIYVVTVVPSLFLAAVLALLESPRALLSSLAGGIGGATLFLSFYGLGWLLYRRPALGSGDILLAALIGAMLGIERLLPTLLLGMGAAAIAAIWLLARRRVTRFHYLPYGSFLAAGAVTGLLLWGPA